MTAPDRPGPRHSGEARSLFEELAELPRNERDERLARLRRESPDLALAVAELLEIDAEVGHFLDRPDGALVLLHAEPQASLPLGSRVGPWRLVSPLGRGGMGEVYLAERADGAYVQRVALKLLRRDRGGETVVARFERERRILAGLSHPGIARLIDGGRAPDGSPYLALDLVEGQPITDHCRERSATLEARIRLMIDACDAVAAAHRELVVHRDLKPSNILVDPAGRVKLLDFGIAKLLDESEDGGEETRIGGAALTPAYAAPEQILGQRATTATDVYGLGVVLYELLTGARPHRRETTSAAALAATVERETIERPSLAAQRDPATTPALARRRAHALRGDLDTILLRALAREPDRRYPSAAALADDLRRYLEGRPVTARPDSTGYRLAKFLRRHRLGAAAAALVTLSLLGGTIAVVWQGRRATENALTAERHLRRAERTQRFLIDLFGGADPDRASGATLTAQELLRQGTARLERELAEEPEARAVLLDAVAQIERRLGRADVAEQLARSALAAHADSPDDRSRALFRLTLGEALFARGELQAARAELVPALAEIDASFGTDSDESARASTALGAVELHLGEDARAFALAESVLARARSRDAGSAETARAQRDLGLALAALDRFAEAERAFAESVAILARTVGAEHTRTASVRTDWAEMLGYLGRHAEAERELLAALAAQERALGSAHPEVGQLELRLGFLYTNARRYGEADEHLRRALAIFTALDHYETGTCLRMLGMSATGQGRHAEAARLYEGALARFRDKLGPGDQLTLTALGNLGAARLELGSHLEARDTLAEAIAGLTGLFGEEADELRVPLLHFGRAQRELGAARDAAGTHRRVLAIAERTVGASHIGAANARRELALDLGAIGRPEELAEARAELDRALEILRAIDSDHPRLGDWLVDSARLAKAARDEARARRDLTEALLRLRATHGDSDRRTIAARRLLAAS